MSMGQDSNTVLRDTRGSQGISCNRKKKCNHQKGEDKTGKDREKKVKDREREKRREREGEGREKKRRKLTWLSLRK